MRKTNSREVLIGDYLSQDFYPLRDLETLKRRKTQNYEEKERLLTEARVDTEPDD